MHSDAIECFQLSILKHCFKKVSTFIKSYKCAHLKGVQHKTTSLALKAHSGKTSRKLERFSSLT